MNFNQTLDNIPSIGPRTAELLAKLGCYTIRDLLLYLPFRYEVRDYLPTELVENETAILRVEVTDLPDAWYKLTVTRKKPLIIRAKYISPTRNLYNLRLVFFSRPPSYILEVLKQKEVIIVGKLQRSGLFWQVVFPEIYKLSQLSEIRKIFPIYHLSYGIKQRTIGRLVELLCFSFITDEMRALEWHSEEKLAEIGNIPFFEAICLCHKEDNQLARRRLIYDEFFAYHWRVNLLKNNKQRSAGRANIFTKSYQQEVLDSLSFALTPDQEKALKIIEEELASPHRMIRLLQGDVGCGKTIIALLAMLCIVESKAQAALMAPTEILAKQHFANFIQLCANLPIKIELLIGSMTKKQKEEAKARIREGICHIIIGTHALIQEEIDFHDLRFAIIDEQHRFGVAQRETLVNKGKGVDLLYMSATPIPRTMALALYGEMDIVEIKSKPAGRQVVTTLVKPLKKFPEVLQAVERTLERGDRIYWICPLIEESEELELADVTSRYQSLAELYGEQVGLVHGAMAASEKDKVMSQFSSGQKTILVATTVIEVGVNVPEASLIIIEQAERFGLAQLHQLRGRVGRGNKQAYCILLYGQQLSSEGRERLKLMHNCHDGFVLAEEDLKLRGGGDLFGTKQSGTPNFYLGDIQEHYDLFLKAWKDVKNNPLPEILLSFFDNCK